MQMNPNQPKLEPHEQAISFDDLEIEAGVPADLPLEPVELPVASSGSLKDKVLAQIKKEKAESISTPAVPSIAPDMNPSAPATFSEPAVTYPDTKPVAEVPLPPIPTVQIPTAQPEIKPIPMAPAAAAATEATLPEVKPVAPTTKERPPEVKAELPTEVPAEKPAEMPTPKKAAAVTATPATTPAVAPVQTAEKTEVRRQIESILQNGLTDMYVQMQPAERAAFSKSANETAGKLEVLVSQFKASAKEVLALIRAWLTKIPRVNKYFLEQASKIKTDEVLEAQRQARKRSRLIH